jgi:hypothetical protein
MNKDIGKLIFRVNDENEWAQLMEQSTTKLVGTLMLLPTIHFVGGHFPG